LEDQRKTTTDTQRRSGKVRTAARATVKIWFGFCPHVQFNSLYDAQFRVLPVARERKSKKSAPQHYKRNVNTMARGRITGGTDPPPLVLQQPPPLDSEKMGLNGA